MNALLYRMFAALAAACLLAASAFAETRIALVIGNADYQMSGWRLKNPVNDARAVSRALEELGFTVTPIEDASEAELERALRSFRRALRTAVDREGAENVIALFYYGGHGMQVDGANYLPGVDLEAEVRQDVPDQSVSLANIVRTVTRSGAASNFFVINACRNTPLPSANLSDSGDGMTAMGARDRALIAYGAQPGQTARDWMNERDRLSPFAEAFVERVKQAGSPLDVFSDIAVTTRRATNGAQRPMIEYSASAEDRIRQVRFARPNPTPTPTRTQVAVMDPAVAEARSYQAISSCADAQAHRRRYPGGSLDGAAAAREASLCAPASRSTPAPTPTARAQTSPQPTGRAPGTVFRDCADCPEMVVIPAGTFRMGSNNGDPDEKPVRSVTLGAFAAGRFEVTFAEWDSCVSAGGCSHRPEDAWGRGRHPVMNVSRGRTRRIMLRG